MKEKIDHEKVVGSWEVKRESQEQIGRSRILPYKSILYGIFIGKCDECRRS